MIYLIIFGAIGFILYSKLKDVRIDFKSFFKKGFKKTDNKFGLVCYTGKQGKGKTYSCVRYILNEQKKHGYTVITNVKSFSERNENVIFEPNIMTIIDYAKSFDNNEKNILIFFDEIFTVLKKGGTLNQEVLSFLSQLRKRKIMFITTAQEWSEINITFRRYVRYQVSCDMISFPFFRIRFLYQ